MGSFLKYDTVWRQRTDKWVDGWTDTNGVERSVRTRRLLLTLYVNLACYGFMRGANDNISTISSNLPISVFTISSLSLLSYTNACFGGKGVHRGKAMGTILGLGIAFLDYSLASVMPLGKGS